LHRIAALFFDTLEARAGMLAAFRDAMQAAALQEGRDYALETHFALGDAARMKDIATEVAASAPSVILVAGTMPAIAAHAATRAVPILMVGVGDPQARGLIASFDNPGGNATGSSDQSADAFGERLSYLRLLLPGLRRLVLLGSASILPLEACAEQARSTGVQLDFVEMPMSGADLALALARIVTSRPDAVFAWPSPVSFAARREIAEHCQAAGLPLLYGWVEFMADAPALAACGPNLTSLYRLAVPTLQRILQGEAPGSIPATRPVFERVLNLDVAQRLGLRVPEAALAASTRVMGRGGT
jgi:putative ABC transport system substrate-binding protein